MKNIRGVLLALVLSTIPIGMVARPMLTRLTKVKIAVILGLTGIAAHKISCWYKQNRAINEFNGALKVLPMEYPELNMPEEQLFQQEGKSLPAVKRAIEKKLVKLDKAIKTLSPAWSTDELDNFRKEIEQGLPEARNEHVNLNNIEYSRAYAWKLLTYAWHKTKQCARWAISKPVLDRNTKQQIVDVLQKKQRLKTLRASAAQELKNIENDEKREQEELVRGGCARVPVAMPGE